MATRFTVNREKTTYLRNREVSRQVLIEEDKYVEGNHLKHMYILDLDSFFNVRFFFYTFLWIEKEFMRDEKEWLNSLLLKFQCEAPMKFQK